MLAKTRDCHHALGAASRHPLPDTSASHQRFLKRSVWRHSEKPSIFFDFIFFLGGGGRHRKGGIDGGRPARVRKSYGCVMWRMAGR